MNAIESSVQHLRNNQIQQINNQVFNNRQEYDTITNYFVPIQKEDGTYTLGFSTKRLVPIEQTQKDEMNEK